MNHFTNFGSVKKCLLNSLSYCKMICMYQTEIGTIRPLCRAGTGTQGAATVLRGEELLLLSKKTFSFRVSTFDEKEVSTLDAESRKDTFDQI